MNKELTPFVLSICNNIRKLRELKDIKQEDLALAINISTPTLSKIENGNDVSLLLLEKICKYLKTDLNQIIPITSTNYNFNDSPNSNGINHNYTNELLIQILQNDIEQKNEQISILLKKAFK